MLQTSDFDYHLPDDLIAQTPSERRDRSRLLHLQRQNGALSDCIFCDLPKLLREGDLLVMNNTRVIPARFQTRRASGGKIEGLFLQELSPGVWEVMLRNAGRCKPGETLEMVAQDVSETAQLILRENLGKGHWKVDVAGQGSAVEILDRLGATPLPPYILRQRKTENDTADRHRYQTIYAAEPGAVAAPTAGLHFTEEVFAELAKRQIERCYVTLHVGAGTFLPVKVEDLSSHQMHSERYELTAETANILNTARKEGRRIVAVGTTSVRVLETIARDYSEFVPATGATDIFIYPPAQFRAVDALITNFHLPKSTLLMLVAAFCTPGSTEGVNMILNACRHAVANKYRFYSYGDAMLIE